MKQNWPLPLTHRQILIGCMQIRINQISAKINTDRKDLSLSLTGYGTFEFLTSWLLGSQFPLATAQTFRVGGESDPPL